MKYKVKALFVVIFSLTFILSCSRGVTAMPWEGKLDGGGENPDKEQLEREEQQEQEETPATPCGYEVGKVLPGWSQGEMDIHAINSARGECTFIIMPDGTTMLVDAGELYQYTSSKYNNVPPRPDINTRPAAVYVNYIRHFLPGENRIDYFNVSHYHSDHIGKIHSSFPKDPQGGYVLAGPAAIHAEIPIKKVIDRSYPNYKITDPELKMTSDFSGMQDFYGAFVEYNVKNRGMSAERCDVGSSSQVVLTKNPSAYPDFKVTCYAGGGKAFNGKGVSTFSAANENAISIAWLFRYGKFEYFTSGDANASGVSTVAKAIGHRIEAMKCHHHMSNPSPFSTENNALQPKVIVTQSFYVRPNQPHQEIIASKKAGQDMFFTNLDLSIPAREGTTVGGKTGIPLDASRYGNCTACNGHIVIRVAPGGDSFYVYMLDDTDMEYRIKSIHGPYTCD